MLHTIARTQRPKEYPERFPVPDEFVDWAVPFPGYSPLEYDVPRADTPAAKDGDFSDPSDPMFVEWFGRQSLVGAIQFDVHGYPLNPAGRTGLAGRGKLNAWGPTVAADGIAIRPGEQGGCEMLVVTRADNGKPSTPGGKLTVNDRNEVTEGVEAAAGRELTAETGAVVSFAGAVVLYKGYVDDERNTDNAWMETTVLLKHLTREATAKMVLKPQEDDAKEPEWRTVNDRMLDSLNAGLGQILRPALLDRR